MFDLWAKITALLGLFSGASCGHAADGADAGAAAPRARISWTSGNSDDTQTVAGLAPNTCGLYDMSGNVGEWTQDWYDDYGSGAATGPTGPDSGSNRVIRGGGWGVDASLARVSARDYGGPGYAGSHVGFRLGRSSP